MKFLVKLLASVNFKHSKMECQSAGGGAIQRIVFRSQHSSDSRHLFYCAKRTNRRRVGMNVCVCYFTEQPWTSKQPNRKRRRGGSLTRKQNL